MPLQRLDKLLTASGAASRSEAKALIRAGRVTVNGAAARSGEEKYDPDTAEICLDGRRLNCAASRYFLMNKPAGVLSATEDAAQSTVLDLLPAELRRLGLFPVGRLDKDTTGALLLTNDGTFAHRVISPGKHVPKVYRAAVDELLDETDVAAFREGIVLRDGLRCLPAELRLEGRNRGVVTVYEGKYHQVRRMFAARGKKVTALHRERIGGLSLPPELEPGGVLELDSAARSLIFQEE